MIKKLFQKFRRLIIYGLVGCVNTAIDWCVFLLLTGLFGATPQVGHAAGYVCGMTSNYLLNRGITFRDGDGGSLARQLTFFIGVCLVSVSVTTFLIGVLTRAGMNKYLAKVIVTILSVTINYLGIKKLVFRIGNKKEDKRDE